MTGMVERNYYDEPAPDQLAARAEYDLDNAPLDVLIARITGRPASRSQDVLDAHRERRQADINAAVNHRLSLARAEKKAARASELAFDEWRYRPMSDSWQRLNELRAAHQAATDELREACLQDPSAIADVRRKVRS